VAIDRPSHRSLEIIIIIILIVMVADAQDSLMSCPCLETEFFLWQARFLAAHSTAILES